MRSNQIEYAFVKDKQLNLVGKQQELYEDLKENFQNRNNMEIKSPDIIGTFLTNP